MSKAQLRKLVKSGNTQKALYLAQADAEFTDLREVSPARLPACPGLAACSASGLFQIDLEILAINNSWVDFVYDHEYPEGIFTNYWHAHAWVQKCKSRKG